MKDGGKNDGESNHAEYDQHPSLRNRVANGYKVINF